MYKKLWEIDRYIQIYNNLKKTNLKITNEDFKVIINNIKNRSFKFQPLEKKYILNNNILIPNSIPSFIDIIILKVFIDIIKEEFIFLESNHSFKSCHTTLNEIKDWKDITWILTGNIKGYYDNIDYNILINILENQIKDKNIIDFFRKLRHAGYLKDKNIKKIISNIYLNKLDQYILNINKEYKNIIYIRYIRYEEEIIIGIKGSLYLTEKIKEKIKEFMVEKLKLGIDLKIIEISKNSIKFLNYRIKKNQDRIKLYLPIGDLIVYFNSKGFLEGKKHKYYGSWIKYKENEIIKRYNFILKGLLNYYKLINNKNQLNYIKYICKYSAAHTIAAKYKISISKVFKKYESLFNIFK
jgi:hypothetical protein